MNDHAHTSVESIYEISYLNERIKELEQSKSDRKKAEKALRESETRFREMFDNAPIGYHELDTEGRITGINRTELATLAYSAEEMLGHHVWEFVDEKDISQNDVLEKLAGILPPGQNLERTYCKKDGTRIPVLIQDLLLRDKDGKITGIRTTVQDITERKRMEKVLQESEELFRVSMEKAPDGVYMNDLEGNILYGNRKAEEIIGYKCEELIGRNFLDVNLIAEGSLGKAIELLKANSEGKPTGPDELELIRKDGRHILIEVNTTLIQRRNKNDVLAFVRDITDRKRMEEALRKSEDRYRTLVENATDIVYRTDDTGHFTFVNPATLRITGYEEDQIIGKHYTVLLRPDVRDDAMKFFGRQFVKQLQNTYSEYPIITKDGHELWFGQNIHLIVEDGNVMGFQSVARDITERKRAEEALRDSEIRYQSIFENTGTAMLIIENDMTISFANAGSEELTGYQRKEIEGKKKWTEFVDKSDLERMIQQHQLRRTDKDLAKRSYEFRLVHRNGRIKDIYLIADIIPGTKKSVTSLIDITDRHQAEAEKRILEEQLQHADKMEAVGTLAGGIAHDFNNLLMGIQGYASLTLLDLDPSHPHYERLKRIEEQVRSGADLTKQLLGFAAGGRYEVKPADMNDILEKSSSMFGRTKKEISIHRKYGKDLWSVEVDRGQMEQVFMNLFVNAWQAMPGGGELYLETENVLLDDEQAIPYSVRPGKYVKISVSDTGTGMDEKTRERIFDPFFTTKEMGRGTGLGLAMVYGIIKGHKGMINVDSEPGHGTTFSIYLPASEKEVVTEKTETGTITMGTETILLVDDEKMVLEVSKEMLESLGYRVYAAGSGQEALAVYMEKRNEIDLVILDMIMPGISGGETFDRLRGINSAVRVLLSSGYSITGQARDILNRGCNGFLQKPFHLEKLSGKVREILD